MHLVPTEEEVLDLLRRSGGLREGHFVYPDGSHTREYLQVPLSMRYYQTAKILSVGLSRLLRAHADIRAVIPELSIVAPATGGLPVAYGICEALRAHQVYWAEREHDNEPLRFREFFELQKGEKIVLVDDILRSGRRLTLLKQLVEDRGGEVIALAVVVHQPVPGAATFGKLPFYKLATLNSTFYPDAASCESCVQGAPVIKVTI
jgi:orotate phosphoribosyltransferase